MLRNIIQHFRSSARRSNTSRKPSSNGIGRSQLSVESLESRIVLTATAGTAAIHGTVLSICGTDAADSIIISDLQDNYRVTANFLSSPVLFPKANISSVSIGAGAGDDTIVATSMTTPITLNGEAGDDRIFGGASHDIIYGGTGDDLIYGNAGLDTIRGGGGADRVFAGAGNDEIHGGDGNDKLVGMDGFDEIHGNDGIDDLVGGGSDDRIFGGAGDDRIFGGAGDDELHGGQGDDTLVGDGDADELFGDAGNDRLLGAGGNDRLLGGLDDDRLVGSIGDDFLSGGDGADLLFGDDGVDELQGGKGNDEMYAGLGGDMLLGNEGDDVMLGGAGDDVLVGHGGQDLLVGGTERDVIIGGADADRMNGENGVDYLVGGTTSNELDTTSLDATRQTWLGIDPATDYGSLISAVLAGYTVDDPLAGDTIRGGSGRDVFYSLDATTVVDREATETVVGEDAVSVDDTYTFLAGLANSVPVANGVLANDVGSSGTIAVVTDVTSGTLTLNADGSFNYTSSIPGTDLFVYEVTPAVGASSRATVNITVDPNAVGDTYTFTAGQTNTVTVANGVVSNDFVNTGTVAVVTAPASGVLNLNADGSFDYTNSVPGSYSFVYEHTPTVGSAVQATASITIDPIANDDSFTLGAGQTNFVPAANVISNDLLGTDGGTVAVVTSPASGTLMLNSDGSFDYTNSVPGDYSFVYQLTPATGPTSQATANITIGPFAVDDSYTLGLGQSSAVNVANGVISNDLLGATAGTVAVVTPPTSGSLTLNSDGSFDYTNSVPGDYSFVYELTPATGPTSQATANVTIASAVDDSYTLTSGQTSSVPVARGVIDNDLLGTGTGTVAVVTAPASGTLALNSDGSFDYTNSVPGNYSFVYELTLSTGGTSQATGEIEVKGLPPIPSGSTPTAFASGVEVYDFGVGTGDMPVASSNVNVDYVGYLPNGIVFDSNEGSVFNLGGVIAGFSEGILGMQAGGTRRIFIPPSEGYGSGGNPGAGISGTDTIVFDVTLNSFS